MHGMNMKVTKRSVYCALRTESSNTAQVDLRFKRLTYGWKRVCIQGVLRPRLSVVFFGPRTNAEPVPKIHVHDSHPILARINLKFRFIVALQTQNAAQTLNSSRLLHTPNSTLLIVLPFFTFQRFSFLPYCQQKDKRALLWSLQNNKRF